MSDGPFRAGFHALGHPPAQIAHIHDVSANIDSSDRTGFFANPTEVTDGRRNDDLSLRADREGLLRTFQAKSLFTLHTHDRPIDTKIIQIQDFDPSQSIADLSGMEKGTGHFALLASRAFVQIGLDQTVPPLNPRFRGDSEPAPSDLGR